MSKITFTPFGRGTLFDVTIVQAAYDNLRTVTNTLASKMSDMHFADDAGVPEILFDFTAAGSLVNHNHDDGSIGASIVGSPQIESSTATRCQFVMTQSPGTIMVFGRSTSFFANANGVEFQIDFASGSEGHPVFLPGTTPMVLLTVYDDHGNGIFGSTNYVDAKVTDVTSSYFKFKYFSNYANAGDYIYVLYAAFGQAPGFVTNPVGVSL